MTDDDRRNVPDDEVAKRARALFDESVAELDAATLSRLNRGRHRALDATRGGRAGFRWSPWVPAGGVAAAAVLAVLVVAGRGPGVVPVETDQAADLEMILEGEDFEMLEDLEFYTWMELEDEGASHVG
jgi:hypothetical protein